MGLEDHRGSDWFRDGHVSQTRSVKTSPNIIGNTKNEVPEPEVARLVDEALGNHFYHLVVNETNTEESRAEGEGQWACPSGTA